MLVVFVYLIALSIAGFPLYPLPGPQAGPQKTSQICILLLQVASLDDFTDASETILMTYGCIRPHFGDIFMHPPRVCQHFSLFIDMFLVVVRLCDCASCLGGEHNFTKTTKHVNEQLKGLPRLWLIHQNITRKGLDASRGHTVCVGYIIKVVQDSHL